VEGADPAGDKKGTNTGGRWTLTVSKSSQREGGNASSEKGTEGTSGWRTRDIMAVFSNPTKQWKIDKLPAKKGYHALSYL